MIKTFEFTIHEANNGRQFTPEKIDEKVNEWLRQHRDVDLKDIKINVVNIGTKLGTTVKMFYTLIYRGPEGL